MLTLGEILALSRRSAGVLDALDLPPPVREALARAAADEGLPPSEFARFAVAAFAREASPDDWSTLLTRLRDAADPGGVCLQLMIERALPRELVRPASSPSSET